MSETKFTKGEWTAIFPHVESKGRLIADCGISNYGDHEEDEANAHLIATTPDMYAMLERQKQGLWNLIDLNIILPQYKNDTKDLINDIETLLRKARGE